MTATKKTYGKHDFEKLEQTGDRAGTSWVVGYAFVLARDQVARGLVRLGVTPNLVTVTGLVLTTLAGVCFALGGGHTYDEVEGVASSPWLRVAFGLLFCAGACDMLDGAVSRIGGKASRFGQLFDSALDRWSDSVLYLGLVTHFAWTGNVTLATLSVLAIMNAYAISYVQARADNLIRAGSVGWWQRPERCFGFLVAAWFGHLPAFVWQQATLPFFTFLFRMRHVARALHADERGQPLPDGGPMRGIWRHLALWRHPRGSLHYDLIAAINIGWIVAAPWVWPFFYGRSDPLRNILEGLG